MDVGGETTPHRIANRCANTIVYVLRIPPHRDSILILFCELCIGIERVQVAEGVHVPLVRRKDSLRTRLERARISALGRVEGVDSSEENGSVQTGAAGIVEQERVDVIV